MCRQLRWSPSQHGRRKRSPRAGRHRRRRGGRRRHRGRGAGCGGGGSAGGGGAGLTFVRGFCFPYYAVFLSTHEFSHFYASALSAILLRGGSEWLHAASLPAAVKPQRRSSVDLHGLQRESLPHHGLPQGLQGKACSGAWSTSSPPSPLPWASAGLFLAHIAKPVIPEALPPLAADGLGLGQWHQQVRDAEEEEGGWEEHGEEGGQGRQQAGEEDAGDGERGSREAEQGRQQVVLLHKEGQEKDTEGEEGGAEQEVAECCREAKGEERAEQPEEAVEGSVRAASAGSGSLPARSCALAVPGSSRDGAGSPARLGLPKCEGLQELMSAKVSTIVATKVRSA